MLRNEIRNSHDITQTKKIIQNIEDLKEFGDSFKYAVVLLGSFFGFRKFYDVYYDSLNLKFYKNIKRPTKQEEQTETKPLLNAETDKFEAKSIFEKLLQACKGVKSKEKYYIAIISQYGLLSKELISALNKDTRLGEKGAPKNVIKFFEKEIKEKMQPRLSLDSKSG
jgi:hypothetical protein